MKLLVDDGKRTNLIASDVVVASCAPGFQDRLSGADLHVKSYRRGRLPTKSVAKLTLGADPTDKERKDYNGFVRYLARGLGETASPPKGGELSGSLSGYLITASTRSSSLYMVKDDKPSSSGAGAGAGSRIRARADDATATGRALHASITAADDETSKAYIGNDESIPEKVRSKRDYLFRNIPEGSRGNIQVDDVALYSVSPSWMANKIKDFLLDYIDSSATITDGTACVGGDTITFAKTFAHINAVELSKQRAEMLTNNVTVAGVAHKVTVVNDSYLRVAKSLKQDMVFVDPPWGGPGYKSTGDKVDLFLGPCPLSELCRLVWPHTRFIAMKLPTNFNVDNLKKELRRDDAFLQIENMNKALLIVLKCEGNPLPVPVFTPDDGPSHPPPPMKRVRVG